MQDSIHASERTLYQRSAPNEVWADDLTERQIAGGVISGDFAYVADQLTMNGIRGTLMSASESCEEVQAMELPTAKRRMGPFVRKHSWIRKAVDYSILKTMETGNMRLWTQRNFNVSPKCDVLLPSTKFKEVEFVDVRLTCQLLAGGLL